MDTVFLRNQISYEEFDYQMLLDCLRDYSYPRDKITRLMKKEIIIRVKKGLYVFGEAYRRNPVSREILANLIYGPSYISLEYALQYYNIIPERVREISSVTTGRSRSFSTPLGVFSYRHISQQAFQLGMDRVMLKDGRAFLIATPEKAIADKLNTDREGNLCTQRDIQCYLLENLRIDPEILAELNTDHIMDIATRSKSKRIRLFAKFMTRIHQNTKRRA
jgi:predicted transcriptional regulator of viral defense system